MQANASTSAGEAIQAAAVVAEGFVKAYYSAQDLDPTKRPEAVCKLYHPTARITWNGNPIPASDLAAFATRLPVSKHEVQSFDCQPVAGSTSMGPPSLVLSVTGQVTHGTHPPNTATPHSKDYDWLPRVFSQALILVWDPIGDPAVPRDPGYRIQADSLRFV
ncbi:BZ3500_MvSof-1268-A1-R1_Chr3-1g05747 [Microbotryum saponariae]|uniref:BZ3500_MvSof-1268-A1-R1_Chr3-1g05747 protein n=1 Tax=Microbotryum saponariae TaxID=289078 RepID=A0A2X0LRT9_9BASI|nr:BZ3500_MvSof-1268-A1-R1_Chr3-1g05747 [Microbotryum saponariae]SDA04937.1 BZ3501_MvSof-1269-A2-R1_Chr3-1g05417 [Microbotryum saponariae]